MDDDILEEKLLDLQQRVLGGELPSLVLVDFIQLMIDVMNTED